MRDEPKKGLLSPKQEALRGLPPEWREKLIESAAEMGISADHDVGWLIVRGFVNAWAAAAAAGEAAKAVSASVDSIPHAIRSGTIAAGADLAHQVREAGQAVLAAADREASTVEARLQAAIATATAQGSAVLDQAVRSLRTAGLRSRDAMIAEWRSAATTAAREAARAAWVRTRAQAWLVALGGLLLAAAIGALVTQRLDRARGAVIDTDARPIVAWAKTAIGQRVYAWSELNALSLDRLLTCDYPGWIRTHRGGYTICYPQGRDHGYYLPPP